MFATNDLSSQRCGWVVESREQISTEPAELLGFLIAHRIDSEWELENLAVAEKARRRGIGTCLLTKFSNTYARKMVAPIPLEVRESNHVARSLYRQAGFEKPASGRITTPTPARAQYSTGGAFLRGFSQRDCTMNMALNRFWGCGNLAL